MKVSIIIPVYNVEKYLDKIKKRCNSKLGTFIYKII